jgi:uncharacterized membrane protein YgcG
MAPKGNEDTGWDRMGIGAVVALTTQSLSRWTLCPARHVQQNSGATLLVQFSGRLRLILCAVPKLVNTVLDCEHTHTHHLFAGRYSDTRRERSGEGSHTSPSQSGSGGAGGGGGGGRSHLSNTVTAAAAEATEALL